MILAMEGWRSARRAAKPPRRTWAAPVAARIMVSTAVPRSVVLFFGVEYSPSCGTREESVVETSSAVSRSKYPPIRLSIFRSQCDWVKVKRKTTDPSASRAAAWAAARATAERLRAVSPIVSRAPARWCKKGGQNFDYAVKYQVGFSVWFQRTLCKMYDARGRYSWRYSMCGEYVGKSGR